MDEFSLLTLNSTHADMVSKLRTEAYRRHYGERVEIDQLNWGPNDERFLNIGLIRQSDRELVAIMRLAFIATAFDFYKVVLLKHSPDYELPLVVLGRAATAAPYEGKGLHGILRWMGLRISKEAGAKSCVGTLEAGSRRLKQMTEIGYEFSANSDPWQGFLKSERPIVVGVLRADHRLDRACEILASRFRERNISFRDEIDHALVIAKLQATRSFELDK